LDYVPRGSRCWTEEFLLEFRRRFAPVETLLPQIREPDYQLHAEIGQYDNTPVSPPTIPRTRADGRAMDSEPAINFHDQTTSALGVQREQEHQMTIASHDHCITMVPSNTGLHFRSDYTDSLIDSVLWNKSPKGTAEDASILSPLESEVRSLLSGELYLFGLYVADRHFRVSSNISVSLSHPYRMSLYRKWECSA
jgi:hypothetical protein